MARREDSNKFIVSVTMFNRTSTTTPVGVLCLVAAIILACWFARRNRSE
jgi:predicted transcriptional regulator YheO